MIRYDPVMHHQKVILLIARVRVRILRRRRSVRRPSRVRDAAVRLEHQIPVQILLTRLQQPLQVRDLPRLAKHLRRRPRHVLPVLDRQSRAVVSAVLQSLQSREQLLDDLLLALRAVPITVREDPAHRDAIRDRARVVVARARVASRRRASARRRRIAFRNADTRTTRSRRPTALHSYAQTVRKQTRRARPVARASPRIAIARRATRRARDDATEAR